MASLLSRAKYIPIRLVKAYSVPSCSPCHDCSVPQVVPVMFAQYCQEVLVVFACSTVKKYLLCFSQYRQRVPAVAVELGAELHREDVRDEHDG